MAGMGSQGREVSGPARQARNSNLLGVNLTLLAL